MSDYHLVSTLHAARVELADARNEGDAVAVAAAEAQVAAARAAVNAALATGRVTSAAHLLDLDLDCLGAILSHLGPEDALSAAGTCTTLRAALFRGGLPGPLAAVCSMMFSSEGIAEAEAFLPTLEGMEPALGATRLIFRIFEFKEGHTRLLARALDAAPHAARIDIHLPFFEEIEEDNASLLADVLSSPDRAFVAPPQVHMFSLTPDRVGALLRMTRAGVHFAFIQEHTGFDDDTIYSQFAASSLTQLNINASGTFNLTAPFPVLRKLRLYISDEESFTTDMPSLTALAPLLKDIEISCIHYGDAPVGPPKHGFGFEPRLFAQFVTAIQGVTRIRFNSDKFITLSQNENENLGQMTALRTLRELEISCDGNPPRTSVALGPRALLPGPLRAPVPENAITNLPQLSPGLTRLVFGDMTRVAFVHPLPGLRVLDLRGSSQNVTCTTFWTDDWDRGNDDDAPQELVEREMHVPFTIPSATIAPNLHTLLIGFKRQGLYRQSLNRGDFDLWTLVAAPTALRVVVIEHARLQCSAPDGFDSTPAGFAALMEREAKDLVSVHVHGCMVARSHQPAVVNFLRALKDRGGRVCRAGIDECLFCLMHDGKDLWPLR